jgi:hypothetical protein
MFKAVRTEKANQKNFSLINILLASFRRVDPLSPLSPQVENFGTKGDFERGYI